MTRPFFLRKPILKLLLFGGKGGVGKTTCATATALRLALEFPRDSFLLVSTDPAHSLADSLDGSPPPSNLEVLELEAIKSLEAFKGQHTRKLHEIARRGTFLDSEDIDQLLELSLPGLDELMAFLEISRWVDEGRYDCIIVDTAPTGHTLRLLAMPGAIRKWLEALDALLAKHRYMKKVITGAYRADELDNFLEDLSASVEQMETLLRDPRRSRFVPVMLPEPLSIRETMMLVDELEALDMPATDIVVNELYPDSACPVCARGQTSQREALENLWIEGHLSRYVLWGIPLYREEVHGPKNLGQFWENVNLIKRPSKKAFGKLWAAAPRVETPPRFPKAEWSLLLFCGKGGVGKTTLACATALRLAQDVEQKEIILFSSDPAHSLSACLGVKLGAQPTKVVPGLAAMEIDAQAEFEALKDDYRHELEEFLSFFQNLDLPFDREVMERMLDLAPPGLDEIMALARVMEFLTKKSYDLLILDSAPTGHLIRLLELPELMEQWLKTFFGIFLKYKEVFRLPKLSQRLVQISKDLKILRSLLKDPDRSAVFAVTILTEMCFQETQDLIDSCKRIGAHVQVLFLNLASPQNECPLCSALHLRESKIKEKFQKGLTGIHKTLVYRQMEPRGLQGLGELGKALYQLQYHGNYAT